MSGKVVDALPAQGKAKISKFYCKLGACTGTVNRILYQSTKLTAPDHENHEQSGEYRKKRCAARSYYSHSLQFICVENDVVDWKVVG